MKLIVNDDPVDQVVTDKLIEKSLYTLTGDEDSFIILSKDEMTYMQAWGGVKKGFILEYQNGYLDQHYVCINRGLSTGQVVRAFQSYNVQDGKWKKNLTWELEDLESASGGSNIFLRLMIIFAVAGFLVWTVVKSTQ